MENSNLDIGFPQLLGMSAILPSLELAREGVASSGHIVAEPPNQEDVTRERGVSDGGEGEDNSSDVVEVGIRWKEWAKRQR